MQAIVGAALQQRILVLILAAALIAGGLFAYKRLNIEAYPDPVPPLVDIVSQNRPVVGRDQALHPVHRSADGDSRHVDPHHLLTGSPT
jgi:Cu/Ag efflux pump CusA